MAGRFSVKGMFEIVDGLTRPLARMRGSVRSFLRATETGAAQALKGLQVVSKQTDRVVASLASLGKTGALVGGAALTAGVASVVKAGADFEEAISAVGAVSLLTREEIADLEKEALRLGSVTKFTATEVAQGQELMGRAGFTNAQILAGMPGLLAAAAAEGGELAETVGIVSNVLKGMGLEATETGRVADVLTLASARTNSSITSLGESLKNAAPIARQFNIPLEQVTSAVALLQDVGIDASEAGTATATMLTLLASPTKQAAAQMKALGIEIADAHGNMLPLPKIFAQFASASKKAGGNVKAAAVFSDLLGMRGQRAGINLTNAFTSGKFAELATELEGAAGSAEKMASLRMDNIKGDFELLMGSVDGVSQAIFGLQSGALRGAVRETTRWVDANKELIVADIDAWVKKGQKAVEDALPKIELFFEGMRTGLRDVGDAASGVVRVLGKLTGAATGLFGESSGMQAYNLGRALVFLTAALVGWSAVTRIAIGIQWAYRAVLVAVRTAKLLYVAASIWSMVATNSETGATVRNTAASWANRAALIARKALSWLVAAGQWALTGATTAGTGATLTAAGATWALVAPLLAAAAAVGALYALWLAFTDLLKQTGGWGGLWEGIKSGVTGGGFFGGIDADLDRKAKEEAALRAQGKKLVPDGPALPAGPTVPAAPSAQAAAPGGALGSLDPAAMFGSLDPAALPKGLDMNALQGLMSLNGMGGFPAGADASKATESMDALTAVMQQVAGTLPEGATSPVPVGTPGAAKGDTIAVQVAAPLDRNTAMLEEMLAKVTNTRDRLDININDNTGSAEVAQAPAQGKVNVRRSNLNVPRNGV